VVAVTTGPTDPPCVTDLADRLAGLGWVSDLWISGSLATGDYVARVSDLDLVAVVDGPVDQLREDTLVSAHRALDEGTARGLDLGCVYVNGACLSDVAATHPTWTHGKLVARRLSGITRAELALHGSAVLGRAPQSVVPAVTPDGVRQAARDEVGGYWSDAVRHPWWWLDPVMPDLGLTSMARARHAVRTGQLLTKTRAIEEAAAPAWYLDQMRARRSGERVESPRLRSAGIAWLDAYRTVRQITP
jgi:hypothetical protein